jgi:DNA repair exonuclease SbcCD ATPase subunit
VVDNPEHQEANKEHWAAIEAEYVQKIKKLEELVAKEKETNQFLQDNIDELRMKRKTESKEWRKERTEYANQIKELTTEIQRIKTEYEQLIEDHKKVTEERNRLTQQIKELTKKLEKSKSVLTIHPKNEPEPQQPPARTNKVILLGESIPSSSIVRAKFDIELVTNSQIEDFLQQGQTADEIWMLTFQISPQKQRKVRNAVGQDQLIEFTTILELLSYINTR